MKNTKTLQERIKEAVELIVHLQTLPPQIDYVSPIEKMEAEKGLELIKSLPKGIKDKYHAIIRSRIDSYYEPVLCMNGEYYSPAEMDAMF